MPYDKLRGRFRPHFSDRFLQLWSQESVSQSDYRFCMKELHHGYEARTAKCTIGYWISFSLFMVACFMDSIPMMMFLGVISIILFLKSMEANMMLELNPILQFQARIDHSASDTGQVQP
jgi:hypothetical protein